MVFFLIKLQLIKGYLWIDNQRIGHNQRATKPNYISKDGFEPPTDSYKETVLPIELFRLINYIYIYIYYVEKIYYATATRAEHNRKYLKIDYCYPSYVY